jgi:hypothetical protein
MIDGTIVGCVSLKITNYTADIKTLSAKKQHKIIKYITTNLRIFNKTSLVKSKKKKKLYLPNKDQVMYL